MRSSSWSFTLGQHHVSLFPSGAALAAGVLAVVVGLVITRRRIRPSQPGE